MKILINKNVILFDSEIWQQMLPLTYTKPFAELRMGMFSFKERWEHLLSVSASYHTQDYLSQKFPIQEEEYSLYLDPSFFPNQELIQKIEQIQLGESLVYQNHRIAFYGSHEDFLNRKNQTSKEIKQVLRLERAWDLFSHNQEVLDFDFELRTKGRQSEPISKTNGILGDRIFLEKNTTIEFVNLNALKGPIYLAQGSEIMEGSNIRGGLFLGEESQIKMGAKIYGATSIGRNCKIGGEVNNSIFTSYSNKGHDGFIGNSVIGEWCNLGADTNNSNLKNNYSSIKMWEEANQKFIHTGLQFCGLIMADHAKSAINTQFNTGTTVGVAANIFRAGFPLNSIPAFSWGGNRHAEKYNLNKCFEAEERMKNRRKKHLTKEDKEILTWVFNHSIQ